MERGKYVTTHFKHEHRESEPQSEPEPTGHVGELRAGDSASHHHLGFQRHAADRSKTRG